MNPVAAAQIPLSSPDVNDDDRQRVMEILSGRTLSLGPALPAFEEALAEIAGTRYAVAVNSGTSALHLAIKAAEIGEGDEVITTPFSFVASANCALYERALPTFVDIELESYNIDPKLIAGAISPRTRAILPVHVFGRPCEMDAINTLAAQRGLTVIEDSCEAIGATYKGRSIGSLGHSGAFAFYPNKQMTTGEGGALVTDDERTAKLSRSWRNQGRGEGSAWLQHERLGYNYRIADINCALGLGQVSRIDQILAQRNRVAQTYTSLLANVSAVIPPAPVPEHMTMSWFVYVVRLQPEFTREQRDEILAAMCEQGVACSNYFSPIHLQEFYREMFGFRRGDFPITEHVSDRTIALPFFNSLSFEQADRVCRVLQQAINSVRPTRVLAATV
jgi:perosamine synthetase